MSDYYLEQARRFSKLAAEEMEHDRETAETCALVAIANALTSLAWTADLRLGE